MRTAVVTGASSGLGAAIKLHLLASLWDVRDWSLETGVDVTSATSIEEATHSLPATVDVLINCAGVNRIAFLPDFAESDWDLVLDTNVKSVFLTTKALAEHLRGGTIVNIVSNASHMPMTNSSAYNASKGAAAILTRQLARELKVTHDITVFAISPNKLAGTGMSNYIDATVPALRNWSPEEARAKQLAALPAGAETPPDAVAEFLAFLLSSRPRHVYLNGCDIPYGA